MTRKISPGLVALAGVVVLMGCGGAVKTETCVPSCPDTSCATNCADPDGCVDDCGVSDSAACAGVECDPYYPGRCLDTCGRYAARCCCVPRTCANATTCVDDCGNFDPAACQGLACGSSCEDTCGEPDGNCWVLCSDPTDCQDDCGNYNSTACSGDVCDPNQAGFDTCGKPADGC